LADDGKNGGRRRKRRPVAQTGRTLGPRALRTRQRILDAAAARLRERSILDLSVVDIARNAGTSPATFYHYFKDVEELALCLAEQANEDMPDVRELIGGSWQGAAGLERGRAVVDAFLDQWDTHQAVLTLRNLAADRGDRRFLRLRQENIGPVLQALAAQVSKAQGEGRLAPEIHPMAAAAALGSILERMAAHRRDIAVLGASREDIRETCARILQQTLDGRRPGAAKG
jgi:AcrR family transcriptional regulator